MPSSTELLAVRGLSPERQQKDYLCGPFHAARVLRDAGFADWTGEPVDQDLVAVHAGATLPDRVVGLDVPPGACSRRDYRHPLPRVAPGDAGTSAPGLAAAIEELSGGELSCVPLRGEWTVAAVQEVVGGLAGSQIRLIANLRTGLLWGSRPPIESLVEALAGREAPEAPAADWDVGHFVELVELLCGRNGSLVLVRDSYPSLGLGGVHLQPPAAVAAALRRGDGRGGGILAVGPPEAGDGVRGLAASVGLRAEMWDN